MSSCEQAIGNTKAWVDKIVVGLNFCPFAKKEVLNDRIRYCCPTDMLKPKKLMKLLQKEIELLQHDETIETTLIILTQGYESFYNYLDMLDKAEDWIDDHQLRGEFQLASFYPDYYFDSEPADSAANYTNRSPYPMLHILREESLEKAIAAYKQPDDIPTNNIAKTKELGLTTMQTLLRDCTKN